MSGEYFETRVQQKMEDFAIQPSAPVWEAVEKRIRKRKDRRIYIFWFTLSFCLVTAGFFLWWYSPVNQGTTVQGKVPATSGQHPMQGRAANTGEPGGPRLTDYRPSNTAGRHDAAWRANKAWHAKNNNPLRANSDEPVQAPAGQEAVNTPEENDRGSLRAATINGNNLIQWQAGRVNVPAPLREHDTLHKQPLVRQRAKHRVTFGFTAGAGASGISSGFFTGLFDRSGANPLYNNYYTNANPSPGSISGNTGANKPSALERGPAFLASVGAARKIGAQLSITVMIRYAQYTTGMEVGPRIDSLLILRQNNAASRTISGYYGNTGAAMHHYTSRLQFLELPVGLERQMGRESPFSINAGLTAGWMFKASALHYDAQKDVYYEDDRLFNRLQLSLTTGFHYTLLQGSGYRLRLGPRFSYSLSHPFSRAAYGATHLYFAGLEAGVIFNKKKQ